MEVLSKIDKQFLIKLLRNENKNISPKDLFQKLWEHFTGSEVASCGFITSGGDSFSALQFISALKPYTTTDNFLSFLLRDSSYNDCWKELEKHFTNQCPKRPMEYTNTSLRTEKKIKPSLDSLSTSYRGDEIVYRSLKGRTFRGSSFGSNVIITQEISFKILWKYQLGKCIDASPLIVSLKNGQCLAIVGSHSGRIAVLNVNSGDLVSECTLRNRVESCACICNRGTHYYIGCYDGSVYKIIVHSGKIVWKFPTGAMVKSTCCLFEESIVFGSYDKNVYRIDEDGKQIWKTEVEGSVLTEAVVDTGVVYVTTLASTLHVLDILTGRELAKYSLSGPVFSSPTIVNQKIVIATVDGTVQWRSLESGEQLYAFKSNGQIFSYVTPHKEDDTDYLIFGSGKHLICLKMHSEFWKIQLDSNIIATPSLICVNHTKYIIVASSKGFIYLIDFNNGYIFKEFRLPKDVYSSPAIFDDKIIIGCRDDNVYCLTLV